MMLPWQHLPLIRAASVGLMMCSLAMACQAAGACESPNVQPLSMHSTGQVSTLAWPAVPGARTYSLWAQWRVPEGEVLRTVELSSAEPVFEVPASPQPWRLLKLQVEVQSRCGPGALATPGAAPVVSVPRVLHQFQVDPARVCARVDGLAPVRGGAGAGSRRYVAVRWQATPDEGFEIAWFDGRSGQALHRDEVQGGEAAWPAGIVTPVLVRATRACGAARSSTAEYLLIP